MELCGGRDSRTAETSTHCSPADLEGYGEKELIRVHLGLVYGNGRQCQFTTWVFGGQSNVGLRWHELSVCAMAVLRNRRGLWGSEPMSRRGPSKAGELGACPLWHQAFQKPPPRRRLLKGLVHQRTSTQLPLDRKRKRGSWVPVCSGTRMAGQSPQGPPGPFHPDLPKRNQTQSWPGPSTSATDIKERKLYYFKGSCGVRRGKRRRLLTAPGSRRNQARYLRGAGLLLAGAASGGVSVGSWLRSLSGTRLRLNLGISVSGLGPEISQSRRGPGVDRGRLGNRTEVSAKLRVKNFCFKAGQLDRVTHNEAHKTEEEGKQEAFNRLWEERPPGATDYPEDLRTSFSMPTPTQHNKKTRTGIGTGIGNDWACFSVMGAPALP
ncbi:hypothetical protein QTO34_001403 [Cnephaeus nilssonii]|uniref:Uncharacterized protein n=1 Tax=Cnephaeus nilssonii TaxID=3371016 RepID=A0AA40HW16_CNENI|nr:hypothetical protein QTO34_001403 [Eptesicus nilssonii]